MNAREILHYAAGTCFLGKVLIASSEKGVCAIVFGDTVAPLVDAVQAMFPHCQLKNGGNAKDFLPLVQDHIAHPDHSPEYPLDVRGTPFQKKVWKELRRIPCGKTSTYRKMAERLGNPKAARAVGSACARNPLSITIPCHRAVRSDGSLANYAWGVERKRALQEQEAALMKGKHNGIA